MTTTFLSAENAARAMGISLRHFRRNYVDRKRLVPIHFPGRPLTQKFLRTDVEVLAAERAREKAAKMKKGT